MAEGRTTNQICAAPRGAVFVWCNHHLEYPRALAKALGRNDLHLVSPAWVEGSRCYGVQCSIVVDHAVALTEAQWETLQTVRARARCST